MFSSLEIGQTPDFTKYLNQYDVIHLDIQWCMEPAGGPENVVSYTENILPIIYTKKEKQEWEALVSYPIPTLCLFLRHLHYYQKFPGTSNRFIYVHNDFQTFSF